MTIFFNNLQRLGKSKLQLLLIIILPALVMLFIALKSAPKPALNLGSVGIVDQDKTDYSDRLAANLASRAALQEVQPAEIQDGLVNGRVDYVVVIDKGFTKSMLQGANKQLKGYYLKDSVKSLALQQYLDGYVAASQQIALAAGGSQEKFSKGMDLFDHSSVQLALGGINRQVSRLILGLQLIFMLLTSVVFTTLVLTDKENKTFYRTLTAPVSLRNYMLQNILSFWFVSVVQVTVVFIILQAGGFYLGDSVLNMYLLYIAASLLCVSLGVAVSSKAKSVIQAVFTGVFLGFPMGLLGGCISVNNGSTNLVRTVGKFTPAYWVMDGVDKLLNNQRISAISGNVLIVVMFAAVLFLFGTWRREDISA